MIHDATMKAHRQGAARERERIIKLLEVNKSEMPTDELEWGIDQAIALIKGEGE
jgi:hypothetical protein